MAIQSQKAKLTKVRDDLMAHMRDGWGVGSSRNEQSRRLASGIIRKEDTKVIRILASIVNAQLALDHIELKELNDANRRSE